MLWSHNIPNFPSARRNNDRLGGGGIFDSAPNNKELPSLEQAIAATANMDTWDNHASSGFAGGSGTSSDPYRIETTGQLAYFAKQSRMITLTGYYSLENSLDMSEYLWLGIGSNAIPFSGDFNGNFNTVSGVIMSVYPSSYIGAVGFFNHISATRNNSVKISDLILTDGLISSSQSIGCVVGLANDYGWYDSDNDECVELDATVSRCVVENYTIVSYTEYSAGIIGFAESLEYDGAVGGVNVIDCIVKNFNVISTMQSGHFYGILYSDAEPAYIYGCAVIDATFVSTTSSCQLSCISTIDSYNSYAKVTYINTATSEKQLSKVLSRSFPADSRVSTLFYSPNLNDGYPIPKSLLSVSSAIRQTNAQVRNYLVSLGFSTT